MFVTNFQGFLNFYLGNLSVNKITFLSFVIAIACEEIWNQGNIEYQQETGSLGVANSEISVECQNGTSFSSGISKSTIECSTLGVWNLENNTCARKNINNQCNDIQRYAFIILV